MKLYKQMVIEQRYGKVKTLVTNNYEEVTKNEVLDILLEGNRQCLYVRQVSKDGIRHFHAHDGDIKQFINQQKSVEDLKVTINSKDMLDGLKKLRIKQPDDTLAKEGITLDHDIVIGINKDLELPTVFIDGERVEDELSNVVLDWETGKEYIASGFSRVIVRTLNKKGLEETMSIHKGPKHEN